MILIIDKIKDSIFKINDLPVGKHTIFPFSKNFIIAPIPIIICTKCKTDIDFRALPNKDEFIGMIYDKVEIDAKFPGGDGAWRKYLERALQGVNPADEGAPEGTFTTLVQFVVDKEGNISDVKALTNHGFGMEEAAIRVIKKGPNWTPAVQNGRAVKAYRKQPITFQVVGE